MKKYTLLITCIAFIQQSSGMIKDINTNKQHLQEAKKQIQETKKQINATYTSIKNNVINKIDAIITTNIHPKINELSKTVNQLNVLPNFVFDIACIGDLKGTLQWIIDNPLKTLLSTLDQVKNKFDNVNQKLNPQVDPEKVYANLNTSHEKFTAAIKNLDELLTALKMAFAEE